MLSWLCQDCDDGLQKNEKGKKAPATTSRNGSNVLFVAWKNSNAIHSGSLWLWTFLDGSHAQISVLQLVSRRAACRDAAGLQCGRMRTKIKIRLVVVWSQCWLGTGNQTWMRMSHLDFGTPGMWHTTCWGPSLPRKTLKQVYKSYCVQWDLGTCLKLSACLESFLNESLTIVPKSNFEISFNLLIITSCHESA